VIAHNRIMPMPDIEAKPALLMLPEIAGRVLDVGCADAGADDRT
jgi:hypothetical protein